MVISKRPRCFKTRAASRNAISASRYPSDSGRSTISREAEANGSLWASACTRDLRPQRWAAALSIGNERSRLITLCRSFSKVRSNSPVPHPIAARVFGWVSCDASHFRKAGYRQVNVKWVSSQPRWAMRRKKVNAGRPLNFAALRGFNPSPHIIRLLNGPPDPCERSGTSTFKDVVEGEADKARYDTSYDRASEERSASWSSEFISSTRTVVRPIAV